MKSYLVFQLPFEHSLKRDLPLMEAFQIEELSDEYVVVARITARTADEAFRIGNFVCEEDKDLIEIVGEMHSISVGDILVDLERDQAMVVADFGFTEITMKEWVE